MEYTKQNTELSYQVKLSDAIRLRLEEWGDYFDVELEYRYRNCIFDLIIVKNNKVILIIETKKQKDGSLPNYNTAQIKKYRRFGIPVVLCGYNKDIKKVAREIYRFCTLSQPHELFFSPLKWAKAVAELKFMAITKPQKLR